MASVVELQKLLDKLIHKSFDSFVSYKKSAKTFDDSKKLMEKDLDIDEIFRKIEYYKEKQKQLEKVNMPASNKVLAYNKLREQQKKYATLLKHVQQNNSDKWLIELEKNFLKGKEIFRENKLVLLARINKLLMSLKKKMGVAKYREFISQLYLKKLTDKTNTYTYTVKTIIKHLASALISEIASKKSKHFNEIKSRKDIKNRKNQMEVEIEMIKLKDVVEKFGKHKELFIDRIKKIIDKEDDDMMKQRLFQVITVNKRNKNGKVVKKQIIDVKPTEFSKFISSKNQSSKYQKEIDKYNLIIDKLLEKNKSIRKRIAKLKGIDLSKLKSSQKNRYL
jgi:hypothetical protein